MQMEHETTEDTKCPSIKDDDSNNKTDKVEEDETNSILHKPMEEAHGANILGDVDDGDHNGEKQEEEEEANPESPEVSSPLILDDGKENISSCEDTMPLPKVLESTVEEEQDLSEVSYPPRDLLMDECEKREDTVPLHIVVEASAKNESPTIAVDHGNLESSEVNLAPSNATRRSSKEESSLLQIADKASDKNGTLAEENLESSGMNSTPPYPLLDADKEKSSNEDTSLLPMVLGASKKNERQDKDNLDSSEANSAPLDPILDDDGEERAFNDDLLPMEMNGSPPEPVPVEPAEELFLGECTSASPLQRKLDEVEVRGSCGTCLFFGTTWKAGKVIQTIHRELKPTESSQQHPEVGILPKLPLEGTAEAEETDDMYPIVEVAIAEEKKTNKASANATCQLRPKAISPVRKKFKIPEHGYLRKTDEEAQQVTLLEL